MLDSGPGSFFLPASQLADSPSSRHGIPLDTQDSLRFYACHIIQEAGILLRMPQAVMATAQVLFHRFFCKRSFRDFDARDVAASCFWLSMKLEESGGWNRGEKRSPLVDVLNVFERIRARGDGEGALPPDCDGFNKRKEELLRLETQILVELGFVCHVEHPHKFLLSYLNCLDATTELVQEAWNLVNDSLRTSLCVRFPSNVVACGTIYSAARRLGVPLPESPAWWLLFDVTSEQIFEVCHALADLYRKPKAQYVEVRACALSKSSAAVQGDEIALAERELSETLDSVSDRLKSMQPRQDTRVCESTVEVSRVEEKSVETAEPVSHGISVVPSLEVRQPEDAVRGVENVSVLSSPSGSQLSDFSAINAPGEPTSKGVLFGGMLMVNPRLQPKGSQGSRGVARIGEYNHKPEYEEVRHSFRHDFINVSSKRDRRNTEDVKREARWESELKRRRKEDDISRRRRAEDRCSSRYNYQKKHSYRHRYELIRG